LTTPKRKSSRRFEQLNLIVDEIALTLGSPAHVAVLLCCFRHAGTGGRFAVSTARIAASCRLSKRQAVRIVDQLERAGVIEMISDHQGPIAKRYRDRKSVV
jgi:DNA-binding MarR family transcriptional regulator